MKIIEPAGKSVVHLAQFTDCHIFATDQDRLLGINTRQSFEAVSAAAAVEANNIDALLATGDLSQDGSAESYQYLARHFDAKLVPTFWIPGNHDDIHTLAQHFTGQHIHASKHIVLGAWQIVMLDSTIAGKVYGRVSSLQLDFLDAALSRHTDKHALVCLHHQALDAESEWIDVKGLKDSEQLRARLAQHDNLRAVLWGHVHQESHRSIDGVEWMSTPSSCVQFKPGSQEFATGTEAPGYRLLDLHADGRIDTRVERVSSKP